MTSRVKLLVTRPVPDAERTAAHLRALDIEPVFAPMLRAIPQDDPLPDLFSYDAIALTSINALRFLKARKPDPAIFQKPVFAIGEATAESAREAGFKTILAAGGTLEELCTLIVERHRGGKTLYPAARDRSGDLKPPGIDILTVTLYAMEMATAFPPGIRQALVSGEIAGALFFSRRTAKAFAELATGPDFILPKTMLHCLCLSENCAQPLIENHYLRIALADHPSHEAMMALALAFTRDQIRA